MTFNELINKIKTGNNFSFARFGDGEINCILGGTAGQPHNCDKHIYYKSLGMRLLKTISDYKHDPDYYMGLQNLVQRTRKDDAAFQRLVAPINWIDADIIHRASIKGHMNDLFNVLSYRNVILVANENLFEVSIIIEAKGQYQMMPIVISQLNAWNEYEPILKRLNDIVKPDDVILYCCGMMAGVLIDDMWKSQGNRITQIDIGSAFDPYVGIKSRAYHHKLKI